MQLQVRAIRSRSGEGLDGAIIIVLLGLAYSFETVVPAGQYRAARFDVVEWRRDQNGVFENARARHLACLYSYCSIVVATSYSTNTSIVGILQSYWSTRLLVQQRSLLRRTV